MYSLTSPDGVLVAVKATKEEAAAALFADVLERHGNNCVTGVIDPLLVFASSEYLTVEQSIELQKMLNDPAEYYHYKIEELV